MDRVPDLVHVVLRNGQPNGRVAQLHIRVLKGCILKASQEQSSRVESLCCDAGDVILLVLESNTLGLLMSQPNSNKQLQSTQTWNTDCSELATPTLT